jgi:protein-arginine kinase activator protein McsA
VKCDECHWDYPQFLLSAFVTNKETLSRKLVCGICALQLSNQLHGDNRVKFTGSEAERLRLRAINWRKQHPQEPNTNAIDK